ncbi:MAG: hypothetical protein AAF355_14825 [Myxococcota bacterium]
MKTIRFYPCPISALLRAGLLCFTLPLFAMLSAGCGGSSSDVSGKFAPDSGTEPCVSCDEENICERELDCGEGVACRADDAALACTPGECFPGYAPDTDGSCQLIEGMRCDASTPESLTTACAELGRTCVTRDLGATCGGCLDGLDETDIRCTGGSLCSASECANVGRACGTSGTDCGACLPGYREPLSTSTEGCIETPCLSCAEEHRYCFESEQGVSCGGCLPGHFERDGTCMPSVACEDLNCEAEGRVCVQSGASYCDTACTEGRVWDADEERCRQPLSCAEVTSTCGLGEVCLEGGDGFDAVCGVICETGFAGSVGADGLSRCFSCSNSAFATSLCRTSGGQPIAGTTGRAVNATGSNGGTCVCEMMDGYFPNAEGLPTECDMDGDGWVNAEVIAFSESSNSGEQQQARCDVRRVRHVRLENDDPYVADPLRIDLISDGSQPVAVPLPLYEHAGNDRTDVQIPQAEQPALPLSGGNTQALTPAQKNSLTKACAFAAADFNQNGFADFQEHQTDRPDQTMLAEMPQQAVAWFGQYTRLSYFIETHEGWFESPETYVIRERPRDPRYMPGSERIAFGRQGAVLLAPGEESEPTGSRYWRGCGRQAESPAGAGSSSGDFSTEALELGALETGMYHHSQFRCVLPLAAEAGYGGNSTAETDPNLAVWERPQTGAELIWREEAGEALQSFAQGNLCRLSAASPYRTPGAIGEATNPFSAEFKCAPSADRSGEALPSDRLVWAVMDYSGAEGLSGEHADSEEPPYDYRRGCINECAVLGTDHCPNRNPDAPSAGFRCDLGQTDRHGEITCGCGDQFSGPGTGCAMACGGDSVFYSPQFSFFDRAEPDYWDELGHPGYWVCIDRRATSTEEAGRSVPTLWTGDYQLRGAIPASLPVSSAEPLTGGGYRLSNRIRAQTPTNVP